MSLDVGRFYYLRRLEVVPNPEPRTLFSSSSRADVLDPDLLFRAIGEILHADRATGNVVRAQEDGARTRSAAGLREERLGLLPVQRHVHILALLAQTLGHGNGSLPE